MRKEGVDIARGELKCDNPEANIASKKVRRSIETSGNRGREISQPDSLR